MSTSRGVNISDVPYVGETSQNQRRLIYDKPKPCYCKVPQTLTGVVALSFSNYLERFQPLRLEDKLNELHRLHLKLDAVVLKHSAVKFSGSEVSYLVAKSGETQEETALLIQSIGQELMSVHGDLKAVASIGEVGFALLGSTAWNYQFYGDMINQLKSRVEGLSKGQFVLSNDLQEVLDKTAGKEQEIMEDSELLNELREKAKRKEQNQSEEAPLHPVSSISSRFDHWWATRVQYTDIWVLFLTFTLSCISIKKQILQSSEMESYHWIFFFLQFQCCLVNVFVAYGWLINRQWFLAHHNLIMSVVWCTQFLSRMVQSGLTVISSPQVQSMKILHQILATNGPEKLLLMTAPVNLWISALLHFISASAAAVGVLYNTCQFTEEEICLENCHPVNLIPVLICIFIFLLILPVIYSIRVEREAKSTFLRNQSKKSTASTSR